MGTILQFVQLISAILAIGFILMQQGKGAEMGAAFGSGASGSLFGASGGANFQSRATAILVAVFLLSTLWLAYIGHGVGKHVEQLSTLEAIEQQRQAQQLEESNTPIEEQKAENKPATSTLPSGK